MKLTLDVLRCLEKVPKISSQMVVFFCGDEFTMVESVKKKTPRKTYAKIYQNLMILNISHHLSSSVVISPL